jgi:hypothetical protein
MRRKIGFVLCGLVVLVGVGLAASPHFLSCSATGPNSVGDLLVRFKIAGLGDTVTTTVTATANATAEYACRNKGGNFPSDPKKQQVSGPVSKTGQFTSGKNGSITGSLTVSPPPSTLDCPGGQVAVVCSVSYTNVQVTSPDAGTCNVSGTFASTPTSCP